MNMRQAVKAGSWAIVGHGVVPIQGVHIHSNEQSDNVYIDAVSKGSSFNVVCVDKESFNNLLLRLVTEPAGAVKIPHAMIKNGKIVVEKEEE